MKSESLARGTAISSPCKGEVGRGSAASRFTRTQEMTAEARRLRKMPTKAEQKLWQGLRSAQIRGLSFRKQHPIGAYVLDFYCPTIRLAIEVGGGQHGFAKEQRHDQRRAKWLEAKGIETIRFWNNDVLGNLDGVLGEIVRKVDELCKLRAPPTPTLPLSGGGRGASIDIIVLGEIDR
jgi:very-short-patch-repair endonuclease